MKIKLIIVTKEKDYAERFFLGAASKRDQIEVDICTSYEKLDGLLRQGKYDVALVEPEAVEHVDSTLVKLCLLLWDQKHGEAPNHYDLPVIRKYQRITSSLSQVQGQYAQLTPEFLGGDKKCRLTAVWSPAGGTGKTTVAVASALRLAEQKKVTYLDLEYFSGTQALFECNGQSISTVFPSLGGNLVLEMQSICMVDSNTEVQYFCPPSNYDDMNELNEEDVLALIKAAAENSEELVIDLSSVCDKKTRSIFEVVDQIYLVVDSSQVAQAKMRQFMNQHDVYPVYSDKITVILNKGAGMGLPEGTNVVRLPMVQSADPTSVYTTLSGKQF